MRVLPGVLLAAALSFVTLPAIAGPHEEAFARFEEGRALVAAGKPLDAVPKFLASLAAEPTAAAALNLADCYERLGKVASAYERFLQAEAISRKAGDNLRADEARKRAEILSPRVASITVLPPPEGKTGSAWIDGAPLPAQMWGKPKHADPGPHEVVLQLPDGTRTNRVVTLGEGTRATVPFDVASKPRENDTKHPPAAPVEQGGGSLRTVGLVTGGIGAAALVAGGVTGILALSAKSDLDTTCPDYPRCPRAQQGDVDSTQDRGETMATVSTIAFVAGGVLLTAGILLYVTSGPSEKARARATDLATGTFRF